MQPIANTDRRTTECSTSDKLGNVSWIQKAIYSCTEGMYHSSTRPGPSLHLTQFYQAFPALATNAGVRRPGYKASIYNCMSVLSIHLLTAAYW